MKSAAAWAASSVLFFAVAPGSRAAEPVHGTDPAVSNGAATFQKYCVLCHGERADGNGVAAKVYNPRPADLTVSARSDDYKASIIRDGGEAVGRSPSMPPWGKELSEAQIGEVVAYLRTVKAKARAPGAGTPPPASAKPAGK